jgi:hypothetical protein
MIAIMCRRRINTSVHLYLNTIISNKKKYIFYESNMFLRVLIIDNIIILCFFMKKSI